jgi:hypothetical protein
MLDRFRDILREEGMNGKDFCEMMGGLSYGSFRAMTGSGKRGVPKWVRAFVIGYELSKLKQGK